MPRPLTVSEVARRLKRDRVTVLRRIGYLKLAFEGAMTEAQFKRLQDSFAAFPALPWGSLR